jgi:hypothetical protein
MVTLYTCYGLFLQPRHGEVLGVRVPHRGAHDDAGGVRRPAEGGGGGAQSGAGAGRGLWRGQGGQTVRRVCMCAGVCVHVCLCVGMCVSSVAHSCIAFRYGFIILNWRAKLQTRRSLSYFFRKSCSPLPHCCVLPLSLPLPPFKVQAVGGGRRRGRRRLGRAGALRSLLFSAPDNAVFCSQHLSSLLRFAFFSHNIGNAQGSCVG